MNACCNTMPVTIPLQRPLWQRIVDRLAEAWRQWGVPAVGEAEPMDLRHALSLNDRLLRDIGVSEVLRDEADARRALDPLAARIGQGSFANQGRHWYG